MPTIAPPEQGYTPLPAGGGATGAGVPPVQIPQTDPGVGPTPSAQPGNQPGGGLTPVPTAQVPGAGSSSGGLGLADLRLPTVDELRQLPGQIDGALHDPNLAANIAQALNDPDVWVEVGAVVVSTVAVGAICAGTAGVGCAVMAGVAVGAVVAGGSYAAKQAIHHEEITAGGLATHVILGGAGGALGGAVGYGGGKAVQAITGKLGKAAADAGLSEAAPSMALRPVGAVLESVEDVMKNPGLLKGQHPAQVENVLRGSANWKAGTLGRGRSAGSGWTFRELNARGTDYTDRYIQWSPGSPRHFDGLPYWKVSSGGLGVVRFPQ